MAHSRLCSIPDCGKPAHAKDYCNAHYRRFKQHGNPFGGRTPKGEPLRWIQEVALCHVGDDCLMWPFSKDRHGYGQAVVDGRHLIASRYICELVHGTPPTPRHDAAHSCGKGHDACVAPGHLSWKTRAANMEDMLIHDTHRRGERNFNAKLTEAAVIQIIAMKGKESQSKLAK